MILDPIEISKHPGDYLSNFRRIVHYSSPNDTGTSIEVVYRVQFLETTTTTEDILFVNVSGQDEYGTTVKRNWMNGFYNITKIADNTNWVNSLGQVVPENTAGAIGQYDFIKNAIKNNLSYYKDIWYNNIKQLDSVGAFDVYAGQG